MEPVCLKPTQKTFESWLLWLENFVVVNELVLVQKVPLFNMLGSWIDLVHPPAEVPSRFTRKQASFVRASRVASRNPRGIQNSFK